MKRVFMLLTFAVLMLSTGLVRATWYGPITYPPVHIGSKDAPPAYKQVNPSDYPTTWGFIRTIGTTYSIYGEIENSFKTSAGTKYWAVEFQATIKNGQSYTTTVSTTCSAGGTLPPWMWVKAMPKEEIYAQTQEFDDYIFDNVLWKTVERTRQYVDSIGVTTTFGNIPRPPKKKPVNGSDGADIYPIDTGASDSIV